MVEEENLVYDLSPIHVEEKKKKNKYKWICPCFLITRLYM